MEYVNAGERPFVGYAQPLSRLQVSWGAVLAGTVTMIAVTLITWMLALAIIFSATHPTGSSLAGSMLATWICAMLCTLIGAFAGGVVAGYLPGNPRRVITVAHGFLAWCLALIAAMLVQLAVLGWATRTTTSAVVGTTTAAVQGAGAAVGGATTGGGTLAQKAEAVLVGLGYPPAQARQMVTSAQADLQKKLHAPEAQTGAAAAQARGAADTILGGAALYAWLTWATWVASGLLAVLGASIVLSRVRLVPVRERESEPGIHMPMHEPVETIP